MEEDIEFFYNKSINENAAHYYEKAKKAKKKIKGILEAIEKINNAIRQRKEEIKKRKEEKERLTKQLKERNWYEKFYYSKTSEGNLIIAGKNAEQNEEIVKKYAKPEEWFFHADIQGGSAVLLKCTNPKEHEMIEAAQIAACYSKAWKENYKYIDVFAAKIKQLTKSAGKEKLPKGGFNIMGERVWFKNIKLSLKIGIYNTEFIILSSFSSIPLNPCFYITPGNNKKGKIAEKLSKVFKIHPDIINSLLPPGKISIKKCDS